MKILYCNKDILKIWCACCFWAFFILFFVSPDSYTHDMFYRWDSAWFFTCGKAWVEGLKPYVDFADSKGPVLWLIHALAYILSPYNYLGIFWLSVILYGIVFYIDYKIALLYLDDKKLSWLVLIFLPLVYFNPWYHFEISAEDWCQPIISLVIYRILRLIYIKDYSSKTLLLSGYILGFGLVWTLLIKFSLTIMLGVTECYCLYYMIREGINLWKPLLSFLLGILTLSFPVASYMLYTGTFDAFINEYFINTLQTVSSVNPISEYIHEWFRTFADAYYMTLFSLCLLGSFLAGRRFDKDRYFLVVSFLGFYALAIHHNIHRHYVNCCLFFIIPIIIFFVLSNKNRFSISYTRIRNISLVIVASFTVLVNWTYTEGYLVPNLFFLNQQDRKEYYTVAYYISQIKKPSLLYYRFAERGYGTIAGALPASKYWSTQTNPTQEMLDIQHNDAVSGKADFVITYMTNYNDKLFTGIGYNKLYDFSGLTLYSKYKLNPPPVSFSVSNMDVLFKRNVVSRFSEY